MASSDVRDVLNLPDGSSAGGRPTKKQKQTGPRPNLKGLAREVLNLGGDNPIAIVPEVTQFKKRRLASRKPAARWELRPFQNSGRNDASLVLRHWRRKDVKHAAADNQGLQQQQQQQQVEDGEAGATAAHTADAEVLEDSTFAKFNVRISVPQYSEDQYQVSLRNDDWTKEETDYLMDMASDYDLRWPIIWDRYEWTPRATNGETDADGDESKAIVPATQPRSMEDLKSRYYEIAAKMMAAEKPIQHMTQQEYAVHEIMAHFNPKQEKLRKDFAMLTLSRSKEEAREEESLLLEIKRILARSERFNEERRELYTRLDYPRAETDINTFKSSAGLQTLLQNLMNADKTKKRKSIMGTDGAATPAGGSGGGATGGPQNATAPDTGKRDSVVASNAATRESTAATSTPTTAGKKGGQPQPEKSQQQQPPERRKLDSREEAVYGISHHDRLGSGPTFRTEKLNKLFSHKSNQQQLRINNTLNELDVPSKLAMPTSATTLQYEQLLAAVHSLLDARKVSDKLDAEIKIEQAKKTEREKKNPPPAQASSSSDHPPTEGNQGEADATGENAKDNGDKPAVDASKGNSDKAKDGQAEGGAEGIKTEEDGQPEDRAAVKESAEAEKTTRPASSSGPHKRSASVLSAVSDKSAKRQKK